MTFVIHSHPAMAEAAVIGVPSEKWTERPMACVVAKWWIPDEVAFVDAIPKTSAGKFAKRFLRDRLKEKRLA